MLGPLMELGSQFSLGSGHRLVVCISPFPMCCFTLLIRINPNSEKKEEEKEDLVEEVMRNKWTKRN
jgi:hypothetical protein